MNDDYLWDRSGQPDPQIQKLEEVLGELRYRERPLVIPSSSKPNRTFAAIWKLAAAAVIAVAIGLGIWTSLQKQPAPPLAANKPTEERTVKVEETKSPPIQTTEILKADNGSDRVAVGIKRTKRHSAVRTNLGNNAIQEGKAAKDDLLFALRLASSKLNQVQKKARGTAPVPAHNQHPIG